MRRRWRASAAWNGAALLLGVAVLALWLWRAVEQTMPGAVAASWRVLMNDLLLAGAVGVVAALVGAAAAALLRRRVPVPFIGVLVTSLLLLVTMGAEPSLIGWLLVCLVVVLAAPLLGGLLGGLVAARAGRGPRPGRVRVAAAITALSAVAIGAGWLAWPGPGAPEPPAAAAGRAPADPTASGGHEVQVATYGSRSAGTSDRYRAGVDAVTEPVDASGIVEGWESGTLRSDVWGFDASALPVNGTVWAPAGGGSRPLVLIVHGNSPHPDSELGFEYLGRLLAGRGHIVASLDQNFLNTGILDRTGGIRGADRARAWLLLKHLEQWTTWAQNGQGPVTATADLDRVALIGHSRGGEAAATAAALRRADADPEQPGSELANEAGITSVIALAPSDGNEQVNGRKVTLEGVNYLTMGGSHDADVRAFSGTNQYARTRVGPGRIKAAVSVYRANHGQFNSRWGRHDAGLGLVKHFLDTEALLAPREQQRAAAAFVSAFLDLTLSGDEAAGLLFQGPVPAAEWLPETGYRVAVASGAQVGVIGFADVGAAGAVKVGDGAKEITPLPLRAGVSDNPVLHLRPDRSGGAAAVTLDEPSLEPGDRIVADLADARAAGTGRTPVTVDVVITDSSGRTATCPLTGPSGVPGQMPGRMVKLEALQGLATSEPVLQSYAVSAGCAAHRGVDLRAVDTLVFRANGLPAEGLYLDNIGVAAD